MPDFLSYLHDISGGATNVELGRIAGVSHTSVGRWSRSAPSPEHVTTLARHYARPVVEAMVAAGYLTAEDAHAREVRVPISEYPHHQLLRELERRLDARTSDPQGIITSPAQYGEEPTPDEYELAAGDVARHPDAD